MALFWRMRQGIGSRTGRAVRALFCIAVALIATDILVGRYGAVRLDLTAEHLYTLAGGTRQTLARIEEPITLRFYYSSKLGDASPGYGVYAQRVRELLDQYVAAARGKIRLEVYDPLPFTDAEDRAVGYGLQAVPLNDQGEAVYFGLAGTNSTDDQQIVAFFNPERERFLEYDLTRLVHSLAFPKRTVVGVMSPLPIDVDLMAAVHGRGGQPMPIIDQLRQVDDVQSVPLTAETIPANIDVLLLVHPQKLPDATLFAIDQFVLRGGKALVFVDPYSEIQAAMAQANPETAAGGSDLEPLFRAWGLKLLPDVVAGDRRRARRVGVPVPNRGSQAMDYVGWLNLQAEDLSRDDPITADLTQITIATAGILQPIEGATTSFTPLIQTSTDSEKIPVEKVKGLPDVGALLAGFKSEQRRYTLAAHVAGDAATAFPEGPPAGTDPKPGESSDQKGPAPELLKHSKQPINVVVVADSDMLDDRFWAQSRDFFGRKVVVPVANNGDFLANAVEVLAGGQDLVDLRSRGTVARPFVVVERIQRSADERFATEQRSLEDKLKQAQAKLQSLTKGEAKTDAGAAVPANPSPDQAKEIDKFRADLVTTRQQLRQVQVSLREDIGKLKLILEFFNIALVPIVVVAAAIVIAASRPRRRRRRPAVG